MIGATTAVCITTLAIAHSNIVWISLAAFNLIMALILKKQLPNK
jgi:hypothetical protein